jgi:hypothetical protein
MPGLETMLQMRYHLQFLLQMAKYKFQDSVQSLQMSYKEVKRGLLEVVEEGMER